MFVIVEIELSRNDNDVEELIAHKDHWFKSSGRIQINPEDLKQYISKEDPRFLSLPFLGMRD